METTEAIERKIPVRRPNAWRSMLMFLSIVGPGIITANLDNDAGGIATYSQAGAQFGYGFLWTLIPITVALIVVQEICLRLGAVTGKGLGDLIRERFGVRTTIFVMVGLVLTNLFTTVAEFAGIAWSCDLFNPYAKFIAVPIAAVFVAVLVLRGNYKAVEKVFLWACLVYVTYIMSGILAHPDWHQVLLATVLPNVHWTVTYVLVFLGVLGTTITPWMQFYIQSSIVEKGVKPREMQYSRIDVITGCMMTDIVAYFIVVACGATLYLHGITNITTAADAARALEPLAGPFAEILFVIGLVNASLFAASVLPLSTAYTVCEALGFESGVGKSVGEAPVFYGLYLSLIVLGALPVLIPNAPLFAIIFYSQVVSGMLLPVIVIAMLRLVNDRQLMGKYVNGPVFNVIAWATACVAILATVVSIGAALLHVGTT